MQKGMLCEGEYESRVGGYMSSDVYGGSYDGHCRAEAVDGDEELFIRCSRGNWGIDVVG